MPPAGVPGERRARRQSYARGMRKNTPAAPLFWKARNRAAHAASAFPALILAAVWS